MVVGRRQHALDLVVFTLLQNDLQLKFGNLTPESNLSIKVVVTGSWVVAR